MNNKHKKKFIINILIGLILTNSSISAIIYTAYSDKLKFDWRYWAFISVLAFNAGLLFLGSALIHKVKADLMRRQKEKMKTDQIAE